MAEINGTPGDDTLNGTSGDDLISGFAGNDMKHSQSMTILYGHKEAVL